MRRASRIIKFCASNDEAPERTQRAQLHRETRSVFGTTAPLDLLEIWDRVLEDTRDR